MNDPILSLRVWSYYVLGLGLALFSIPNVVFDIFGIATRIHTSSVVAMPKMSKTTLGIEKSANPNPRT